MNPKDELAKVTNKLHALGQILDRNFEAVSGLDDNAILGLAQLLEGLSLELGAIQEKI